MGIVHLRLLLIHMDYAWLMSALMWLYVVESFEYVYDVVQLNIGFWSYLFESLGVIGVRGRFNDIFR